MNKVLLFALSVSLTVLAGCASTSRWLVTQGPNRQAILGESEEKSSSVKVLPLDEQLTARLNASDKHQTLSSQFSDSPSFPFVVGPGDLLEVTIWEAPPATLFGASDLRQGISVARNSVLPEQMVSADGNINIPFIGLIHVAGKTLNQIEQSIVQNLQRKANQPQVVVRMSRNVSSTVTIVGEVVQNQKISLTPKGERVLDAIAASGGARNALSKTSVQITRNNIVSSIPMTRLIDTPSENIRLMPGDLITLSHQPMSFIALGAVTKNEEVNFESQGISLAQALGRIGGLSNVYADSGGVFVFRFEDPLLLGVANMLDSSITSEGKIPVVYHLDLQTPNSLFVAQSFPVRNKDVLYVSTAPSADLQKFLNILTSSLFSVSSIISLSKY